MLAKCSSTQFQLSYFGGWDKAPSFHRHLGIVAAPLNCAGVLSSGLCGGIAALKGAGWRQVVPCVLGVLGALLLLAHLATGGGAANHAEHVAFLATFVDLEAKVDSMLLLFTHSGPFQIGFIVVGLVAVFVIDCGLVFGIGDKLLGHESVGFHRYPFSFAVVNAQLAVATIGVALANQPVEVNRVNLAATADKIVGRPFYLVKYHTFMLNFIHT